MSSHQDSYSSPFSYEGGSEPPVAQYQGQSWPQVATTGDQPHQSVDPVGNLLEAHDAEVYPCHNLDGDAVYPPLSDLQDMNYPFNYPHPDYPLPSTSLHDPSIMANATYTNDDIPFHPPANLPFSHHIETDYIQSQNQNGYDPYEQLYDYPTEHFVHDAPQTSGGFVGSFGVQPIQNITTSETTQGPPAPIYPYLSPTPLISPNHGEPVHQTNIRAAWSTPSLTLDGVDTARMELPNTSTRRYSHPSSVVTSPSIQTSVAGPSHPAPSSPERKRSLPSADDGLATARRVVPRHDRERSVQSTSSDSHRRSYSNSDVHGRGPVIPQERYTTSGISSYNTSDQHPPITFDLENPDQIGVPIADVLNKTDSFIRIRNRAQAFSHMGKKTFTLRVQWPGYRAWSKTIAALDWTKSRSPITRVKLAEAVATGVRDLIEKYRGEPYDPDYAEWNVGPNGIQLDQICLVALHHVSKGSWQPVLCLLGPRR